MLLQDLKEIVTFLIEDIATENEVWDDAGLGSELQSCASAGTVIKIGVVMT